MNGNGFIQIIVSILTGGLMAGLFSTYKSNRRIKIEVITNERKKWRDTMRFLAKKMLEAKMDNEYRKMIIIYCQLATRLNPNDCEDLGLLEAAKCLFDKKINRKFLCNELNENEGADSESILINEFIVRMALLLKHDWERAKIESAPWWHLKLKPSRIKYCDFMRNKECNVKCFFMYVKKASEIIILSLRWLILFIILLIIFFMVSSVARLSYKFLIDILSV